MADCEQFVMECSDINREICGFKCCKNKPLTVFICIKCLGIYHKSCFLRLSNKKHINDNKILCSDCVNEVTENDEDEEVEILQQSITELKKDNEYINEHFLKFKQNYNQLLSESLEMEHNLMQTIDQYKEQVKNLEEENTSLKKRIADVNRNDIAIQTDVIVREQEVESKLNKGSNLIEHVGTWSLENQTELICIDNGINYQINESNITACTNYTKVVDAADGEVTVILDNTSDSLQQTNTNNITEKKGSKMAKERLPTKAKKVKLDTTRERIQIW